MNKKILKRMPYGTSLFPDYVEMLKRLALDLRMDANMIIEQSLLKYAEQNQELSDAYKKFKKGI